MSGSKRTREFPAIGEAHPSEGIKDVIVKRLKPLIVGKDSLDVEPLYNYVVSRTVGKSTAGTVVGAIGGVETALWNIAGKTVEVPVYRLLGRKYRDRIRRYADVGRGRNRTNTPEVWVERAKEGSRTGSRRPSSITITRQMNCSTMR